MDRILLIFLLISIGADLSAQRDSSLTEDFGKLSAKQRTKIALQEKEDAAKDAEFQALMSSAETHFQAREYDEALAVYKLARKRRPYNVHPKVKIQDLEAFIKERDRKQAETAAVSEAKAPPVDPKKNDPPRSAEQSVATIPVRTDVKEKPAASPRKAHIQEAPKAIATPAEKPIDGERIYKEAGAVVIERVINEEGRSVVYKKVIHRSSGTVHFRNGEVITQRVWEEIRGR